MKIDQPQVERVTKQERVLTLLSQPEGASIEEMMQATDWQQHSVRGFLAVSTAETKCAKWRRDNVPVGLRERGFEAPVYDCVFVST